jgi:hypothetical protein
MSRPRIVGLRGAHEVECPASRSVNNRPMFMVIFWAVYEEVLCCFFRVAAHWASQAVNLLESMEVLIQGGVSHPQLKDSACCLSGYSLVTHEFKEFL